MRYAIHAFNTWLLAQPLHAIIVLCAALIYEKRMQLDEVFQWTMIGLVFSVPAMVICLIICKPIRNLPIDERLSLLLWALSAALSVFVTIFLLLALMGVYQILPDVFLLIAPGSLAAFASAIIRFKQFFKLSSLDNEESSL